MIQEHKQSTITLKKHLKNEYKKLYPLLLVYFFVIASLVLFTVLSFMSAIGGLADYENFLLNELQPTYESTGTITQEQATQFESFGKDMYFVLFLLAIIIIFFSILFSIIKTIKDILLWKTIDSSFVNFKKEFLKYFMYTAISFISFFIIAILSILFIPKPIISFIIIVFFYIVAETASLSLQAQKGKNFFSKSTLKLFIAHIYTATAFLLIWWLGILLIGLTISSLAFLVIILLIILFLLLYSIRILYLFHLAKEYAYFKEKRKRLKKK